MDALAKAVVTATVVALLLIAVPRFGQRLTGLVASLPVISVPALCWLAIERGAAFAATAAAGSAAVGGVCAVFCVGYANTCERRGPRVALLCGLVLGAILLWPMLHWRPGIVAATGLSLLVCLGCNLALDPDRGLAAATSHRCTASDTQCRSKMSVGAVTSAIVAGAVSAIVATLASRTGPFAAGALASVPLIAAIVAVRLHRDEGVAAARGFLGGYLGGVALRTGVVAWIGALTHPTLSVWAPLGLITLLALIVGPRLLRCARRLLATNDATCRP